MRLAFVGLGNMGGPMARNLLAAGHSLSVADLDPQKVARLVDLGAEAAVDAAAAVDGADAVLTSLPGPAQIAAVGALIVPAMRPGSLWIELSTNDLECARSMAALADTHGVRIVDAPVSGGWEGAEAGNLTVLVGGTVEAFDLALPVLQGIGHKIEHMGQHGAGYVAKISQVMLCYLNSVCLTEALVLGSKGGVDPQKMLDVIQHSAGRSYVAERYGPEILNGGYDDTFHLGLAVKDLHLALNLAAETNAKIGFTERVFALYEQAERTYGFSAPHLIAMQAIERDNDLILNQQGAPT